MTILQVQKLPNGYCDDYYKINKQTTNPQKKELPKLHISNDKSQLISKIKKIKQYETKINQPKKAEQGKETEIKCYNYNYDKIFKSKSFPKDNNEPNIKGKVSLQIDTEFK